VIQAGLALGAGQRNTIVFVYIVTNERTKEQKKEDKTMQQDETIEQIIERTISALRSVYFDSMMNYDISIRVNEKSIDRSYPREPLRTNIDLNFIPNTRTY
jgi:predicted RNA-binding protein